MIHTAHMHVSWLVPQRVMGLVCISHLMDADCGQFDEMFVQALDQADAKIHLVAQVRDIKSFPSMRTTLGMRYMYHLKFGMVHAVTYSQNPVLRFLVAAASSAGRLKYKELPTFEEACLNAIHVDPTLPRLSEWTMPSQAILTASPTLPPL